MYVYREVDTVRDDAFIDRLTAWQSIAVAAAMTQAHKVIKLITELCSLTIMVEAMPNWQHRQKESIRLWDDLVSSEYRSEMTYVVTMYEWYRCGHHAMH